MKVGRILKLAGLNYINSTPPHLRDDLTKQLNVVVSAAETFNAELAVVAADVKLTEEGRGEASRKVAAAALATLQAIENTTLQTLANRTVSLEQTLLTKAISPAPKDPAERLAYELRLQEIRDQLRQLPASERLNAYRTTTDPMMLAAIESAPVTLSETRPGEPASGGFR